MSSLIIPDNFDNMLPVDLSMGTSIGGEAPRIVTEEQLQEFFNPTFIN